MNKRSSSVEGIVLSELWRYQQAAVGAVGVAGEEVDLVQCQGLLGLLPAPLQSTQCCTCIVAAIPAAEHELLCIAFKGGCGCILKILGRRESVVLLFTSIRERR